MQHSLTMEMNSVQADLISDGDQMPSHLLSHRHFEVGVVAIHQTCVVRCSDQAVIVMGAHQAVIVMPCAGRWRLLPLMHDLRSFSDHVEVLLNHVSVSSGI